MPIPPSPRIAFHGEHRARPVLAGQKPPLSSLLEGSSSIWMTSSLEMARDRVHRERAEWPALAPLPAPVYLVHRAFEPISFTENPDFS